MRAARFFALALALAMAASVAPFDLAQAENDLARPIDAGAVSELAGRIAIKIDELPANVSQEAALQALMPSLHSAEPDIALAVISRLQIRARLPDGVAAALGAARQAIALDMLSLEGGADAEITLRADGALAPRLNANDVEDLTDRLNAVTARAGRDGCTRETVLEAAYPVIAEADPDVALAAINRVISRQALSECVVDGLAFARQAVVLALIAEGETGALATAAPSLDLVLAGGLGAGGQAGAAGRGGPGYR